MLHLIRLCASHIGDLALCSRLPTHQSPLRILSLVSEDQLERETTFLRLPLPPLSAHPFTQQVLGGLSSAGAHARGDEAVDLPATPSHHPLPSFRKSRSLRLLKVPLPLPSCPPFLLHPTSPLLSPSAFRVKINNS